MPPVFSPRVLLVVSRCVCRPTRTVVVAVSLAISSAAIAAAAPALTIKADRPDAVYGVGEKITWSVESHDAAAAEATYVLKRGGEDVIGKGRVTLDQGHATITASLSDPGTLLAEVTVDDAPAQLAGAAVAPNQIGVSSSCPADFDAFWRAKLAELAAVPVDPKLTPEPSGRAGVDYWKVTLANIRGTHVQGQLARPAKAGRFPALVLFQYAGVYPLQKQWVTDRAAEGWLVLDVNAHDLPIDQPPAFYQELASGALKDYPSIGNDDREKSYFLRMFLGCYRAVEYLAGRPDWDARTLVVSGTSQGGLQSFVAAALNPKVTGLMALAPAGFDDTGDEAGRRPGWPYWIAHAGSHDPAKVRATARYFDAVNFAARVTCPSLVGVGLIDVTAPPSGVFAGFNQLKGPKEIVVMPDANHHGDHHTHAPYMERATALRTALLAHTPDPLLAQAH